MPSICLSSTLANCANGNMWPLNVCCLGNECACFNSQQTFATCATVNSRGGVIRIMQGVPAANFSELTLYTSRSSDTLIEFTTNTYSGLAITNQNPNQLTFFPITASASGIATWFWVVTATMCIYGTGIRSCQHNRLYGSVGLPGSGADLEISDTNIVAGNVYKIVNLRIGLPQSYTY